MINSRLLDAMVRCFLTLDSVLGSAYVLLFRDNVIPMLTHSNSL